MVNLGCPEIEGVYCLCKQRLSHEKRKTIAGLPFLPQEIFCHPESGLNCQAGCSGRTTFPLLVLMMKHAAIAALVNRMAPDFFPHKSHMFQSQNG